MEGLAIDDRQRRERHPDTFWSEHAAHRAPQPSTTELVRSHDGYTSTQSRQEAAVSSAWRPKSDLHNVLHPTDDTDQTSPTAWRPPPSEWNRRAERPSLPSLRTILGSSISTPSRTPSPRTALSQTSPPPTQVGSLPLRQSEWRPTKKQRTESFDYDGRSNEEQRARSSNSDITSAAAAITPLGLSQGSDISAQNYASNPLSARAEVSDTSHTSLPILPPPPPPPSTPGSATAWPFAPNFPRPPTLSTSSQRSSFESTSTHQPTFEQMPASVLEPSFAPSYAVGEARRGSFSHGFRSNPPYEPSFLQRSSSSSTARYSASPHDQQLPRYMPDGDAWRAQYSQESISQRQESSNISQPSHESVRQSDAYQSIQFATSIASFPIVAQHEVSQGRSRMRSNLPKHSTEIMKRWFNDNISNPYPSEEQKAYFSKATGISLTQVSNWFINHRRRCPELRDKRDKGRSEHELDN